MPSDKSCAFSPCAEVKSCAMVGGCISTRFPQSVGNERQDTLKAGARKLAGDKPTRAHRSRQAQRIDAAAARKGEGRS